MLCEPPGYTVEVSILRDHLWAEADIGETVEWQRGTQKVASLDGLQSLHVHSCIWAGTSATRRSRRGAWEKSAGAGMDLREGTVSCVEIDVSTGQEGRRIKALGGRIQTLDFILGLRTSHWKVLVNPVSLLKAIFKSESGVQACES